MGTIRVGVSGWDYDDWQGRFYPATQPRAQRLAFVASRLDTVECNATFYSLTTPAAVRRWRDALPAGRVMAIKGSRYITHVRRLRQVRTPLATFFASGILELGARLGPVLWQLPPRMRFDPDVLDGFLGMLPHDTEAAAALAAEHDDRVVEPAFGPGEHHRLRHVLEVRDPRFLCAEAVRIARHHGVALAFSHSSAWPYVEEITAGFVYVRLHGPEALYASPYEEQLSWWAARVRAWHQGGQPDDAVRVSDLRPPVRLERDVYVYFDNDTHGYAPREALALRSLLLDP